MKFACAPESRPLPGYTIKRAIDRGAFGEVYYAVSDGGKEVALKLLHTNQAAELRGVSQCLNLKHPNLVAIYDIRTDDEGDAWVVMEYIAGESLEQRLARCSGGLPVDEVLRWVEGFAAGIDYLHARGIVHRDLKPANVFLDGGLVKIADVGLSKFMTPSRRSAQTESVGTVYYMAPEVAHGKYGRELDVYSLAVIAYEMLTGHVPFDGESTGEILMKHLAQPPDLGPLPERLRPVIAAALEKDPQKRTSTAGKLAAAFREAVTGKSVRAGGDGRVAEAVSPPGFPRGDTAADQSHPIPQSAGPAQVSAPPRLPERGTRPVDSAVEGPSAAAPVENPVPRWLFPTVFGTCLVMIVIQRASARVVWQELALLAAAAGLWQGWEWWQAQAGRRASSRFADWLTGRLARRGYELRPDWRSQLGAVVVTGGIVVTLFVAFAAIGAGPLAILLVPGMVFAVVMVSTGTILRKQRPADPPAVLPATRVSPVPASVEMTPLATAAWVGPPQPPPLPTAAGKAEPSAVGPIVPGWGDLFLSLSAAGMWSVVVGAILVGLLPEWDTSWQELRHVDVAMFLVLSTTASAWLMLAGVWWMSRRPGRVSRPRLLLTITGLAAGAAVYGLKVVLQVNPPFPWSGRDGDAMLSQLGRHPLLVEGQGTLVGLMLFFGLLFAVRTWWRLLSPERRERFDVWDIAGTTLLAYLLTFVIRFPAGWAFLWGLSLAAVASLSAPQLSLVDRVWLKSVAKRFKDKKTHPKSTTE